jgi:hypothetical protein
MFIGISSAKTELTNIKIKIREEFIMNSEKDQVDISDEKFDVKKVSPFLQFLASVGGRVVITIVLAAIIYGLIGLLAGTENTIIMVILCIGCGYFGWQSLNKITPNLFLWMPLGAWAIYYIVKGLLSVCVGTIVAPLWLGKRISYALMTYVDNK